MSMDVNMASAPGLPRNASSSSLSSCDEHFFCGYSLYSTGPDDSQDSEQMDKPTAPCGVRPECDADRTFKVRVEELLRSRAAERRPSPKRHCGANRFGSPDSAARAAPRAMITPVDAATRFRKRTVTMDEDDDGATGASSSDSSSDDDGDERERGGGAPLQTPLSRSGSRDELEDLLAQAGAAPPLDETETPTAGRGPQKKVVTPYDDGSANPGAAFSAAEALLMVSR